MRSIVVWATLVLVASTPAVAETTKLGGAELTEEHGRHKLRPDEIVMRAPPSRPEYAGDVFFVRSSDLAQAEADGFRVMTDEEIEAWQQKQFDDAAALVTAAASERSVAGRWRIAAILLGAVAVATTALAAWLVARRRAAG